MNADEKLAALQNRLGEIIEYLDYHKHDTQVLLLHPPLNAVAWRTKNKLVEALDESKK